MDKDVSLFSSLNNDTKEYFFVAYSYAVIVVGCGRMEFHNVVIFYVYHVPSLSSNLFSVPQLTQARKKVKFWPNRFVVNDINNEFVVVFLEGIIDPKEKLYNLYDFPKKDPRPIALINRADEWSITWYERLKHMNL
jgi:hypothetical protein